MRFLFTTRPHHDNYVFQLLICCALGCIVKMCGRHHEHLDGWLIRFRHVPAPTRHECTSAGQDWQNEIENRKNKINIDPLPSQTRLHAHADLITQGWREHSRILFLSFLFLFLFSPLFFLLSLSSLVSLLSSLFSLSPLFSLLSSFFSLLSSCSSLLFSPFCVCPQVRQHEH